MRNILKPLLVVVTMGTLLAGVALAGMQSADTLGKTDATDFKYVEDSSNASVTLVAGVTGQTVSLYKFTLSTATADNFYLKCGATHKTGKLYLAENSGLDSTLYPLYIRCASGETLSLVKGSASSPIGITLWFNQEP